MDRIYGGCNCQKVLDKPIFAAYDSQPRKKTLSENAYSASRRGIVKLPGLPWYPWTLAKDGTTKFQNQS